MIHWYNNLYMDEKVRENPKRCMRHVERCAGSMKKSLSGIWRGYYAIALPSNEENLFDIMGTRQLFFRRYAHLDLYVIGLAKSYDSALELLIQILRETAEEEEGSWCRCEFDKSDFSGK